jgi:hypothetical protein
LIFLAPQIRILIGTAWEERAKISPKEKLCCSRNWSFLAPRGYNKEDGVDLGAA